MTEQEKVEFVVSPENYLPLDVEPHKLRGSEQFIKPFAQYVGVLWESQYWPLELLEQIQLERLRRLTAKMAEHSLFWAHYFRGHHFPTHNLDSLGALHSLPLLGKKQYQTWGEQVYILLDNQPTRHYFSSGTTGQPVKMRYGEVEALYRNFPYYLRHPAFVGTNLGELLQRKFMITLGHPGGGKFFPDFISWRFPEVKNSDFEDPVLFKNICQKLEEAKPALLYGFASLILEFTRRAGKANTAPPLWAVRITSDYISEDERNFIRDSLKVPVINILSTVGVGNIGFECMENTGKFHLNAERVILEVVDENNEPLGPGKRGRFVVTALDGLCTPSIRYETGDMGTLLASRCPCGRTLPLFEFTGRRNDVLITTRGRSIPAISLHRSLAGSGAIRNILQYQIAQEETDRLKFLIIPRKKFTSEDEVKLRLAITELFGEERVVIDVEYVETIEPTPGGKQKFFLPLRSK